MELEARDAVPEHVSERGIQKPVPHLRGVEMAGAHIHEAPCSVWNEMLRRQEAHSNFGGHSSVYEPERFTPMLTPGVAPSASSREAFPEVTECGVLLPESFAGESSPSRQLAPSVPRQSGLSPTSYGRLFDCQRLYTVTPHLTNVPRSFSWH